MHRLTPPFAALTLLICMLLFPGLAGAQPRVGLSVGTHFPDRDGQQDVYGVGQFSVAISESHIRTVGTAYAGQRLMIDDESRSSDLENASSNLFGAGTVVQGVMQLGNQGATVAFGPGVWWNNIGKVIRGTLSATLESPWLGSFRLEAGVRKSETAIQANIGVRFR